MISTAAPCAAAGAWGGPDHEALRLHQQREHRAVLLGEGRGDQRAVAVAAQRGPQVVLALVVGGHGGAEARALRGGDRVLVRAQHAGDGRAQEDERADQRGDRVAGQPEQARAADRAEHQRLAGPHGDLPEVQREALVLERIADQVVLAHRGAAGGDKQVRAARAGGEAGERFRVVAGDAEVDRLATAPFDHRAQRVGVGANDLALAQRLARHHDLVAGGQQGDARLAADRKPGLVHRRGEPDGARVQPAPGRDANLADAEVEARGADVAAGRRALAHTDRGAFRLRVLLDHDGVGRRRAPARR